MATPTKDVSVQSAYAGMPSVQSLPTNIVKPGVLSPTSVAGDCFVYQRFSLKLQAYMVSYVSSLAGNYPIPYV